MLHFGEIQSARLLEILFEKHLSLLWCLLTYELFGFSMTYYLYEGGINLWTQAM